MEWGSPVVGWEYVFGSSSQILRKLRQVFEQFPGYFRLLVDSFCVSRNQSHFWLPCQAYSIPQLRDQQGSAHLAHWVVGGRWAGKVNQLKNNQCGRITCK